MIEKEISALKERLIDAAEEAYQMLSKVFDGFIEHRKDLLSEVLKAEEKLNAEIASLVTTSVDLSKKATSEQEKKKVAILLDNSGEVERIGDHCQDLVERIEIKIVEKLLFSEDAVEEYRDLFGKVEGFFRRIIDAYKSEDRQRIGQILKEGKVIDNLTKDYHNRHVDRLVKGICPPRAANMFLDMLDFTNRIYHHAARIGQKVKK